MPVFSCVAIMHHNISRIGGYLAGYRDPKTGIDDSHLCGINAAQPRGKAYKLTDRNGLYLFVAATGTKSWRYKYDFGGKERLLTFGRFPDLGLADARGLHEEARRLIRDGKDPVVEAKRRKQTQITSTEATFKKIAEIWLEEQRPLWSPANAKRVRHRLTA